MLNEEGLLIAHSRAHIAMDGESLSGLNFSPL
jgi:hypothetical protein